MATGAPTGAWVTPVPPPTLWTCDMRCHQPHGLVEATIVPRNV